MNGTHFLKNLLDGSFKVKWTPLGQVANIKSGAAVNKRMIADNPGEYPVLNSGRDPLGYINEWNTSDDPIGITTRGAGVGSITWQEGKFYRGNLNYSVTIKDELQLSIRYLYHLLLHLQPQIHALCTFDGIPALNASNLKNLEIPIPCPGDPKKSLAIQTEIVRILDAFTTLEAELEAELEARRQQYQYYRETLLVSDDGDRSKKLTIEWKALDEIGHFIRGRRFTKKDYTTDGIPCIHYGEIYTHYGTSTASTVSFVHSDMASSLQFAEPGDLVIAGVGETVEDVGKAVAWLGTEKVAIHDDSCAFRHPLNPKYVSYCFQTAAFHAEKQQYVARGKVKRVSSSSLGKIHVPIPYLDDPEKSLVEQARIVAILDKFDALMNDLTDGLPAEINARRKQYEYYRDQLLTFPQAAEAVA